MERSQAEITRIGTRVAEVVVIASASEAIQYSPAMNWIASLTLAMTALAGRVSSFNRSKLNGNSSSSENCVTLHRR